MSTISTMGGASSTLTDTKVSDHASLIRKTQDVYSMFHLRCRSCKHKIPFKDLRSTLEAWIYPKESPGDDSPDDDTPIGVPRYLSVANCPQCNASTCMGCGRKPKDNNDDTIIATNRLKVCCEKGRLFCIWLILCRFDDHELELQAKVLVANAQAPKVKKPAKDTGVGYDVGHADWGYYEDGVAIPQPTKKEVIQTLDRSDCQMRVTLVLLVHLLSKSPETMGTAITEDE